jgi:hypothetical protein
VRESRKKEQIKGERTRRRGDIGMQIASKCGGVDEFCSKRK